MLIKQVILAKLCEHEAVDCYVDELQDALEEDGVNFKLQDLTDEILPGSLVILCGLGRAKRENDPNESSIIYAKPNSKEFAEIAWETLYEWGKCYVSFSHKAKYMIRDMPLLRRTDVLGICIEPFSLDGENYEDYLARVTELGKIFSLCVSEYIISREKSYQGWR